MEDYDVDTEEEKEVLSRVNTMDQCWYGCDGSGHTQPQEGLKSCMVNSRSWAEELQDIFAGQAEDCLGVARTRLSSISCVFSPPRSLLPPTLAHLSCMDLQYMRGSPGSSFTAA
ncbi:hypothetical protein OJAV_G00174770 [Oryzias javanicus]|uniref:Uncharacterized protein n=1 Tax=Oryzias javanicus TaxID=123683 RepID=A0A437CFM7_ORYJA|nr:hypothetical protein OJAV_G00174770 [Oryzias javanicus]